MKTWFSIKAKADSNVAEISIFDDIGAWGVTAQSFIGELKAHAGKEIVVSINSPGGSVFDALAIYNALRAHGNVTVKIMGVAASAASLIAMAGDKIVMPENAFMMIHNPWMATAGNAEDLRDMADFLDTIGASLTKTYVARTGLSEDEVKEMLAAETWLTAAQAVEKGFATEVEAALKVAASYDLDRFPENVRAVFDSADNVDEPVDGVADDLENDAVDDEITDEPAALADEINAYAKSIGMEAYAAHVALIDGVNTLEDAKAKFSVAREVNALCALAGVAEMAPAMIRAGMSLADARAKVTEALAAGDEQLPSSSVKPSGTSVVAGSATDVWNKVLPQLFPQPAGK